MSVLKFFYQNCMQYYSRYVCYVNNMSLVSHYLNLSRNVQKSILVRARRKKEKNPNDLVNWLNKLYVSFYIHNIYIYAHTVEYHSTNNKI